MSDLDDDKDRFDDFRARVAASVEAARAKRAATVAATRRGVNGGEKVNGPGRGGPSREPLDPPGAPSRALAARVPLTEKQRMFAEIAATNRYTLHEAARLAGYTDPSNEIDRLIRDPEVCAHIVQHLQPRVIKFERMLQRAWEALDFNLDPRNWEPVAHTDFGMPIFQVTSRDRTASADVVFKVLARIDPELLTMRARRADVKQTLSALAAKVLMAEATPLDGEPPPEGPPATGDEPPLGTDDDATRVLPPAVPDPADSL